MGIIMLFVILLLFVWFICTIFILSNYGYFKNISTYWEKRQIPGPKPKWLFGNSQDYGHRHFFSHAYMTEIYSTYPDEPAVGLFSWNTPTLFVKDLDIIQEILVKKFQKFPDRRLISGPFRNPLIENLSVVNNPTWKLLRKNLSLVFTSVKLKQTIDKINTCTNQFIEVLNASAEKNEPIELCALAGKLTIDILTLNFFGIYSNTLINDYSQFQRIVPRTPDEKDIIVTTMQLVKFIYFEMVKALKEIFGIYDKNDQFLIKVIRNWIESRKKSGSKANDFLDTLINLQDHPEKLDRKEISDDLLIAQAYTFIKGGDEPMSLTISHALYELASNQHIQDKVRNEITKVSDHNKGELDYNALKNAKYLDKVVKETLRKYPPIVFLIRRADGEHTFLDTSISICKKCKVVIPIYAIHHDAKIYPEPEKFDPDRFDEEVAKLRPKMSYLPFGDGPRMCIGSRFALDQIKLCLAIAIRNFKFGISEKTGKVYRKLSNYEFLAPDGGLIVSVEKI